jgi:addiction module HigA family antidote
MPSSSIIGITTRGFAMRMHNPPHPGELLREQMGDLTVIGLAAHLGVSRITLSRLLNGQAGVSAEMSLKLSEAFGTSPDLWMKLQLQYDFWKAAQKKRKKIRLLPSRRTSDGSASPRPHSLAGD